MVFLFFFDNDDVFSEINIMLFVDVMFVLLVVFIVIVLLLNNVVYVNLLNIVVIVLVDCKLNVIVSVDGKGVVYFDKCVVVFDMVLVELVVLKVGWFDVVFDLQVDEYVLYGIVVKLMVVIEYVGIM